MDERTKMLDQVRRMGVADERVLAAMGGVDRRLFVPWRSKHLAYGNMPLPIGVGQTISQPYTVARMIELLVCSSLFAAEKSKVLEVGTGSGWETAVLARLFGRVYSVERIGELAEKARIKIDGLGIENVEIKVGDGKEGWEEHAPYEAIIVAADAVEVPEPLVNQLVEGGGLVIPVHGKMTRVTKGRKGKTKIEKFGEFSFVPLV